MDGYEEYRLRGIGGNDSAGYPTIAFEGKDSKGEWTTISAVLITTNLGGFVDDINAAVAGKSFDVKGKLKDSSIPLANILMDTEHGIVIGPSVVVEGTAASFYAIPDDGYTFKYWNLNKGRTIQDNPITVTASSDSIDIQAIFEPDESYHFIFLTDWQQLTDKLPNSGASAWSPIIYTPMTDKSSNDLLLMDVLQDDKLKIDIATATAYISNLLNDKVGFDYEGSKVFTTISHNVDFINNIDTIFAKSSIVSKPDDNGIYIIVESMDSSNCTIAFYKYYEPLSTADNELLAIKWGDKTSNMAKLSDMTIDVSRLPYFIALATTGNPFTFNQIKTLI